MEKKVWLSIKGMQDVGNNEAEKVELYTEGKLYHKNKSIYILYKESEVSGMDGTTTTVKIDQDQLSIIRLGSTNSHLSFQKGESKYNRYATPYGEILLNIYTNDMEIQYNEDKDPTRIRLDYRIDIDGGQGAHNQIDIQVKQ